MARNQQRVFQDRRVAFAITDRSLCVSEVSGASDVLLTGHGEPLGRSLLELVPELVGSEEALSDILGGRLPRLQIPWVNRDAPDGSTMYHTLVVLPYFDEHNEIAGVIHIVQDVTEIGVLEQQVMQQRNTLRVLERTLREQNVQLLAANAELRQLDEAKSTFVSIAAHELRTPLASISGYLEMLLDGDAGPLNPQQAEYLQIVASSTERLLCLTRDLLDVVRLESGRLELHLMPTDLPRLVESVIAEHRPQLESRDQQITLLAPGNLPLALVDPGRTVQIVANLLSNASKYSPPSTSIFISVALLHDEPGYLEVTVQDRGPGIDGDELVHLFRPFMRGRAERGGGEGGSGLGLFITKSLVELHGGHVSMASQPGVGSTVSVTLPTVELA